MPQLFGRSCYHDYRRHYSNSSVAVSVDVIITLIWLIQKVCMLRDFCFRLLLADVPTSMPNFLLDTAFCTALKGRSHCTLEGMQSSPPCQNIATFLCQVEQSAGSFETMSYIVTVTVIGTVRPAVLRLEETFPNVISLLQINGGHILPTPTAVAV